MVERSGTLTLPGGRGGRGWELEDPRELTARFQARKGLWGRRLGRAWTCLGAGGRGVRARSSLGNSGLGFGLERIYGGEAWDVLGVWRAKG